MPSKENSYSDMLARGILFLWRKADKSDLFEPSEYYNHRLLHFGTSPCKLVFSDGSEQVMPQDCVCYIPPETGYKVISEEKEPDATGMIFFGMLADTFSTSCHPGGIELSVRPTAVDGFMTLYNSLDDIEPGMANINRTANAFYSLMIDVIFSPSNVIESKSAMTAQKIKQYIENNIDSDISVTTIAKQFYLSETHVIRIFKEKYGITPKQYILKSKINASKLLLLDTSLQIKEIAMTYHFADSYHFSHTFKRFTGVSPEKYRLRDDRR